MMAMRDIKILTLLNVNDKVNPYKSMSFDEVGELYSNSSKIKISESTIRRSLKILIENECVAYGYKRSNVKTYYITDSGIKLLSEIKGE